MNITDRDRCVIQVAITYMTKQEQCITPESVWLLLKQQGQLVALEKIAFVMQHMQERQERS
jgi:hypothetical protein